LNAGVGYFNVDNLTNQACHLGILNNAENVYNRIKSHNLLDDAFRANPSYQLLVTGHSLGAGTAVIVALKLKSEYPNIKCIAFSPPGGLISQHLAEYTRSFVMSVVIGDDIVPRLSVHTVHNLKADILKVRNERITLCFIF
jgi:sn1-specific diacylglycerol lipase